MSLENLNKKEIGARIKSIRTSRGLTLEKFGELFSKKASKSIVSRWESGKSIPNNERLKEISDIFDVSTMYLLYGKKTIYDIPVNKVFELSNDEMRKNTWYEDSSLILKEDTLREMTSNQISLIAAFVNLTKRTNPNIKNVDEFFNEIRGSMELFDFVSFNQNTDIDYQKFLKKFLDVQQKITMLFVQNIITMHCVNNNIGSDVDVKLNESNELTAEDKEKMKRLLNAFYDMDLFNDLFN